MTNRERLEKGIDNEIERIKDSFIKDAKTTKTYEEYLPYIATILDPKWLNCSARLINSKYSDYPSLCYLGHFTKLTRREYHNRRKVGGATVREMDYIFERFGLKWKEEQE